MRHIFSRLNIVLLFLNACLVLGIAYLWYPHISDVRGDVSIYSVQEGITSNSALVTSIAEEEVPLELDSSSQLLVTSSTIVETETIEKEVTEGKLPAVVNLPVPFTSQAPEGIWSQPWQDACEEAAILMLDAYYKKYNLSPLFSKDEILKMVDWQTARSWGYSIPMTKVEEAAEWYIGDSFALTTIENPTIVNIQNALNAGHPVLVVANGKTLGNPYFSGEGPVYHALIIRGYTDDGFITNDPGTKRGEGFVYEFDTLMNSIHDWNDGDVPNGRSVVLIVDQL